MPKAARSLEPAVSNSVQPPAKAINEQKFNVFLVTDDDALWPLIGADLSGDLILKQLDSVDELLNTVPPGEAGIVLWDARAQINSAAVLSTLSLHSPRFAVVVLDSNANAGAWTLPLQHRLIVAHVGLPLASVVLGKALESAREEIAARLALLGDQSSMPVAPAKGANNSRWLPIAIAAAVVALASGAALMFMRGSRAPDKPAVEGESKSSSAAAPGAPRKVSEAIDEKVDALIEKAQQAMLERHFIDPAAGSALNLYRDVLLIDPNNGEARQGLQRLEEILIARVQSALDERRFDLALPFLETARSINPNDRRLAALDERIAGLRAELGPAQITAAFNAQNFDRAAQLIDEAERARSLPAGKLAQLRDDLRKRRGESDMARLLKLIDTRLQQGKLLDPANDSAAFYLAQAKQAGAAPATLQALNAELQRQMALAVRGASDTKHFSDAEQQPQFLELARARLTQGKLLEPNNDNAMYYLNQLRAADPKNAALPQLAAALQDQILERGHAALDVGDTLKAQAMLQAAMGLGASPNLEAFSDKLRQRTASVSGAPAAAKPPAETAGAATATAPPELPEQSLTRLNKLEALYPPRAQEKGLEGWVQIGFTVNSDGTVSNVTALNSFPANTFEQAGIKAVSRLRYQPVLHGGKPIAVNSQLRVVFRMPK